MHLHRPATTRGHGVGVHCRRGVSGGHARLRGWHHARRGREHPPAPRLLLLLHASSLLSLDHLLLPHTQVRVSGHPHLVATSPHGGHGGTLHGVGVTLTLPTPH